MTENDAGAKPSPKRTSGRAVHTTKTAVSKKRDMKAAPRAAETSAKVAPRKAPARAAGNDQAHHTTKADEKHRGKRARARSAARPAPAPESGERTARRRRTPVAPMPRRGTERQLETVINELRGVQTLVRHLAAPPQVVTTTATDPILEDAVDSLRRLLSELIEQRREAVVRDLVEVRTEVATASANGGGQALERLDQLLGSLGTVKFEARRFDAVDPLIHVAVEEHHESGVPGGVILATVRPGFRTGRGFVVCKAAVSVNREA